MKLNMSVFGLLVILISIGGILLISILVFSMNDNSYTDYTIKITRGVAKDIELTPNYLFVQFRESIKTTDQKRVLREENLPILRESGSNSFMVSINNKDNSLTSILSKLSNHKEILQIRPIY